MKKNSLFSVNSFFLVSIVLLSSSAAHCRTIIEGNSPLRDGKSFSFPIKAYNVREDNVLIVGAQKQGVARDYAVAFLNPADNKFKPYAPETIIHNSVLNQPNPLFNAGIAQLACLDPKDIAVVTQESPTVLCNINFLTSSGELLSISNLMDASGNALNGGITCVSSNNKGVGFVALKGNGQDEFGSGQSGIGLVQIVCQEQEQEVTDAQIEEVQKKLKDATEQEVEQVMRTYTVNAENKKVKKVMVKTFKQIGCPAAAVPLSCSSDTIKIGNDAQQVTVNDMYWSHSLGRLYIALSAQAGSQDLDGVRGIVIGDYHEETQQLTLHPIIAPAVVAENNPIAARGSGAAVAVHKVRTMQTSTGFLDYLIVLEAHSSDGAQVHAFPLLNYKNEKGLIEQELAALHGALASTMITAESSFKEGYSQTLSRLFFGRHFVAQPQSASDLAESAATRVGAGCVPGGVINDIIVKDDAVYAIVADNLLEDAECAGTVMRSQAIFDAAGHIIAWTAWQKIIHSNEPVFGALIDRQLGNTILLAGTNDESIGTITRSEWAPASSSPLADFAHTITSIFDQKHGGVHALKDFAPNTPGLRSALLAASGLGMLALAQIAPTAPLTSGLVQYKKSSIDTPFDNANLMVFSGGALEQLGAITAMEVGATVTNGWFFAGGVGGLAVLCNADGSGWAMPAGLGENFNGLQPGMAFKRIGDFSMVRKLMCDEHYLYVLSDHALDRIDLRAVDFATNTNNTVRLATAHAVSNATYAIFYDVLISGKLALIAHSNGLARNENGCNIQTDTLESLAWKNVPIIGGYGPVVCMAATTVTGRAQDLARYDAGQLYIISGLIGQDAARLHRLVVHNATVNDVCDTTVQPLPDIASYNRPSFFAQFGSYRNLFVTDGSLFLSTTHKSKTYAPMVISGFGPTRAALPLPALKDARTICAITRSSAWGNWMVAGDFGLLVNE